MNEENSQKLSKLKLRLGKNLVDKLDRTRDKYGNIRPAIKSLSERKN